MLQWLVSVSEKLIGQARLFVIVLLAAVLFTLWSVFNSLWSGSRYASELYYQAKLSACLDTSRTVAAMAAATTPQELNQHIPRFEQLYFGELILFEDQSLEFSMIAFRDAIGQLARMDDPDKTWSQATAEVNLQNLAVRVSHACHDNIQPTFWSQIWASSWNRQKTFDSPAEYENE
ncbi:MAG: hypothetical protein AAGD23_10055 [Pseudomonadota bacterium]